ncbi:hypothetical protein Tco_0466807, partial [Tanacetum coccineum]
VYVLLVYCTTGCVIVNTVEMERGFLSQKGSWVGRSVKEKQVSLADKSVEGTKHVNDNVVYWISQYKLRNDGLAKFLERESN